MGRLTPQQAAESLAAAGQGDGAAWEELVDAYVGLIWGIVKGYGLDDHDAHDVSQTTWLRLVENIARIDDAASVGAWLATTARRECLKVLRQSRRELPKDWADLDTVDVDCEEVGRDLFRLEQSAEVRGAVDRLNPTCQALIWLLMLDPAPSYEEISAALSMPTGSIGPTRARCLRRLEALMSADASQTS